jgi:hypothetical protein
LSRMVKECKGACGKGCAVNLPRVSAYRYCTGRWEGWGAPGVATGALGSGVAGLGAM